MSSADKSHIINELAFHILHATDKNVNICLPSLAILESLNVVLQSTTSEKLVDQIGQLVKFSTEEKKKTQEEKVKIICDLIHSIIVGDEEFVKIHLENGICVPAALALENVSSLKNIKLCKDEASTKKINEEIGKLTENRLKNFLNDQNKPKSGITLFNVLHLTAEFCNIFRPDSTEIQEFHISSSKSIKIPMLRSGGMLMYNDDKEIGARVMYHNFLGCNFQIYVITPIKRFGLEEMEKKLTAEKYKHLLTNMRSVLGSLSIPKLILNQVSDLGSILKKSGLTDLFDSSAASLKKITKSNAAIEHFAQGTSIKINEFGSNVPKRELMESELYGMCSGGFMEPPEEQSIIADEPFLLIINFEKGNNILSINRVVEPVQSE